LLRDSAVRFAGYKVPHPLINDAHIKVQTYNNRSHPIKVFLTALEDLNFETDVLEKQFAVSDILHVCAHMML
jgi:DNA-directed RNA polymerase II subunit RPB11